MPKIDIIDFCGLTAGINKRKYYDAVKPEIQAFAKAKFGQIANKTAYDKIFQLAWTITGGLGTVECHDYERIVGRMGKGRDGKGSDYSADRKYADWAYYFFLFGEDYVSPAYGDRISQRLFGEHFYDHFIDFMRLKNISRPNRYPPLQKVDFGSFTVFLDKDASTQPLPLWSKKQPVLMTENGPDIFAALHWKTHLTKLFGRNKEKEEIIKWARDPDTKEIKVMLISGPGGSGKSRLAGEVVGELIRKHNWSGGFPVFEQSIAGDNYDGSGNGVVVVIDYPEEDSDQVDVILKRAGKETQYKKPVRIILTSRENQEAWKRRLNRNVLVRFREISLQDSHFFSNQASIKKRSEEVACDLACEALKKYAKLIGYENRIYDRIEAWIGKDKSHLIPLNILAASVHAILDPESAFKLGSRDILLKLADIELKRVRFYSKREFDEPYVLEKILALSIFVKSGLSSEIIYTLGEISICSTKRGNSVLEATRATPFWKKRQAEKNGYLPSLEPDLVAVAFFLRVFFDEEPSPALQYWLLPLALEAKGTFTDILSRTMMDIYFFGKEHADDLLQCCLEMIDHVPDYRTTLMDMVCRPRSKLVAKFTLKISDRLVDIGVGMVRTPYLMEARSEIFHDLGKLDDALEASDKALYFFRFLSDFSKGPSEHKPNSFDVDLAFSLNSRSGLLSDLGKEKEAYDAIYEAVQIRRRLFKNGADYVAEDLALSLINMSNRLMKLNRYKEAIPVIEECVNIHKNLHYFKNDAPTLDLALAYHARTNLYFGLNQIESAYISAEQAVIAFRNIAEEYPDRFNSLLAAALGNKAKALSQKEYFEASQQTVNEAISIRKDLFDMEPASFAMDFLSSLAIKSSILFESGDMRGALNAVDQAKEVYFSSTRNSKISFLYAETINFKGIIFYLLSKWEESAANFDEAGSLIHKIEDIKLKQRLCLKICCSFNLCTVAKKLKEVDKIRELVESNDEIFEYLQDSLPESLIYKFQYLAECLLESNNNTALEKLDQYELAPEKFPEFYDD